jgi:predicted Zn-dependent protease
MPIRNQILSAVQPVVHHGLREASRTSVDHAMFEVAAISYLMGAGYDYYTAHRLVESWEIGEAFPPYQGQAIPYYQMHHTF